jgi:endonuclease YncB( thermonuclease family)
MRRGSVRGRRSTILLCVAVVGGAACGAPPATDRATSPSAEEGVTLVRVDDVAAARLRIDGRETDVRLIGVDGSVPEELGCDPAGPRVVTRLLSAGALRVETDSRARDPDGRTLAWVWVSRKLVNAALLRAGAATLARYWPNQRHEDELLRAQLAAARPGRGLWSRCPALHGVPATDRSGRRCDPSYPGTCIAPYPPDLRCEEIPFSNMVIVGPDLHDLDGDGDGLGCERFNPM